MQNDDSVKVDYRIETMSNGYDSTVFEILANNFLNYCIGVNVNAYAVVRTVFGTRLSEQEKDLPCRDFI